MRNDRPGYHAGSSREPWSAVDLYWIPLGAGAHVVRASGKAFEAISALVRRRPRRDLYHSALVVHVPEGRFVIEQTPVIDLHGRQRGVVAEGPVGTRWLGRFRHFRYEIRRWREGVIPDVHEAIASPVRLTDDLTLAERVLDLLPCVPTPVWGRDELAAGDMWNSNSVVSWILTRSEVDLALIHAPFGGRAPGWDAGIVVASRNFKHEEHEEHERCAACGFDGGTYDRSSLLNSLRALGGRWRAVLDGSGSSLRVRPEPAVWSAIEYAAHSRDITALHAFGIEQALEVDEPMYPQLADDLIESAATTYREDDPKVVVDVLETEANRMAALADGAAHEAWNRGLTIGESRTDVRWLLEHGLHDSLYHLDDVERGLAVLGSTSGKPA